MKNDLNKDIENYESCLLSNSQHFLDKQILLPTAKVCIEVDNITIGPLHAILDTGAEPSIITCKVVKKFQLPTSFTDKGLIGIDGESFKVNRKLIAKVKPWFVSEKFIETDIWILPNDNQWHLISPIQSMSKIHKLSSTQITLADPEYFKAKEIHMILGVQVFAKCMTSEIPRPIENYTTFESIFGVIVFGADTNNHAAVQQVGSIEVIEDYSYLERCIHKLWQLDQVPTVSKHSKDEQLVEQIFIDSYHRDSEGRFTVSIPLKPDTKQIGSSKAIAYRRFMQLEKKFDRDPEYKEKYVQFMREYQSLNHMQLVTREANENEIVYHIPHHGVQQKFRVVFDGSCVTDKGISLNEVQIVGSKLQLDLAEIVMRFRRHRVAINADIHKMFRQVKIVQNQWNLQRIFWREDKSHRLKEYWLTVVTYGLSSSPYNAVRAVIQCARDMSNSFPAAATVIEKDFYMDDCLSGANSVDEAIKLANELNKVLLSGGFELRKWHSNSSELKYAMSSTEANSLLISDELNTSVLGLKWNTDEDIFTYVVKFPAIDDKIDKRTVLSRISQVYDPNGYVSPVIIKGRLIMQDIWKSKIDWDDQVSSEIAVRWKEFWQDITELERFKIDRWLSTGNEVRIHIHGFADASSKAYGACIYVRTEENRKVHSKLLVSKAKVAPIRTVQTIPKLELCAMELLLRLLVQVRSSMEWENVPYTLWTDSTIALCWLKKEPYECETFVANRISSIQNNTDSRVWRHISSKDNPADLLSRGLNASELVNNKLWLHGPSWLLKSSHEWPKGDFDSHNQPKEVLDALRVHIIVRRVKQLSIALVQSAAEKKDKEKPKIISLMDYTNSLDKLINITAYVMRFIKIIKKAAQDRKEGKVTRKSKRFKDESYQLTIHDRAKAFEYHIKVAQKMYFQKEIKCIKLKVNLPYKSRIESLRPLLDNKDLLRVGGRLERAEIDYEMKHPVIIPKWSRLSYIVINKAHQDTKHGNVQIMSHNIRQKYWIPQIRDEIRKFILNCATCARYNKKLCEQIMSDLPADRINPGELFVNCGVDFAGPFEIKEIDRDGNQLSKSKCWVAVFVCLKSRAIHIDIVRDLTAVAFIACFERFISRRGPCERMYSDNGTSFVATAKELKKAYEKWKVKQVFDHLQVKNTEWIFMTPAAPHQGGIYEAAVKSMKYHLVRIVGSKCLTYDQLHTILVQIEAILNSRPLQPISEDCNDMEALTPGHFIRGGPMVVSLPFDIPKQSDSIGIQLWREREQMMKQFWERWQSDYLTTLQERKKWRREQESLKVGQLVLLKAENFPPSQWALARVKEIIVGGDGKVRNVKVKTANSEFLRPVQKLCILPTDANHTTDPRLNKRRN